MNRLSTARRALMFQLLIEGNSQRATSSIIPCEKHTVRQFIAECGPICRQYEDETLVDLPCKRVEVDELWSYIYAKRKNVAEAKSPPAAAGDVWTWTAICADTRLLVAWRIGDRSEATATPFMQVLHDRLAHRVADDHGRPHAVPGGGADRVQGRRGLCAARQDP